MSLRVLLADESPSIKKAFTLALQDYDIKIQTAHHGVDVKELFQSFSPDICFMDILLPKLNGYEACLQLKNDDSSKSTPVVLMWSGFMELDQSKFTSSQANGSIEKPFETETLRSLVKKLVAKLNQNELSDHLIIDNASYDEYDEDEKTPVSDTPDLPPLEDLNLTPPNLDPMNNSTDSADATPLSKDVSNFADFDSILKEDTDPDSSQYDTPEGLGFGSMPPTTNEEWQEQPLQEIDSTPDGLDDVDSFSVQSLDNDVLPFKAPDENVFTAPEQDEPHLPPTPNKTPEAPKNIEPLKNEDDIVVNDQNIPQLSKEELKRLILAQSKDIIETVVWDVVPELAKEMIQKEIQRLTGELKYEDDLR